MLQYELLYILPGTTTEEEVAPVIQKVEEMVRAGGGTSVTAEHGGKNRLSYAMNHVRYGFFELCYFSAEPKQVAEIEAKLRLMPELLRVVIRRQAAGAPRGLANAFVPITREQGRFEERKEMYVAAGAMPPMPRAAESVTAPAPSTVPVETKLESQQLEDITKKLDEILEKDLANT